MESHGACDKCRNAREPPADARLIGDEVIVWRGRLRWKCNAGQARLSPRVA